MGCSVVPVLSLRSSRVVDIVRVETESHWRRQPAVADWLAPLIEQACEKAGATRQVRKQAREFAADSTGSYYFDSKDLSGPQVTYGISASHETGVTYLAFSNRAVAIDCCASDRAGEVLSAGQEAFTEGELAMLLNGGQLVAGWCAVECLCKLWGAGILQPNARPRLLTMSPMTARGTEFGSVGDIGHNRAGQNICVWATKTPTTNLELAA